MKRNETQYDTKYTIPLVLVSVVTIFIFFFLDDMMIQSLAFTTLALLLTLNTYEAYLSANKEKYKFKLGFSILAFIIFLVYTIILMLR